MSASGPLGEILTFMSQNAAYYAWTDFDRAVSLAAQFERTEIRMMAQTKMAQSILAGPPRRFKFPDTPGYKTLRNENSLTTENETNKFPGALTICSKKGTSQWQFRF